MIVGHDIAVGTDDDTGSQADLVTGRLCETEKQVEQGARLLVVGSLRHLDIDDCLHGSLGGIGEIGDIGHLHAALRN